MLGDVCVGGVAIGGMVRYCNRFPCPWEYIFSTS